MNIECFMKIFLFDLKNQDKNCLEEINDFKSLIKLYFSENGNPEIVNKFVERLNDIIIHQEDENGFILIKKVLTHKYFSYILLKIKNSDVLIQSCKIENINAIKWLLTMNINLNVQDSDGMTALMYASEHPNLLFLVKHYLHNSSSKCLNLENNEGNNALFFSINNEKAFNDLLKSKIDISHLNKQNESILIYCCKNEVYPPVINLINKKGIDINGIDNDGKTALMYLAEKARSNEFHILCQKKSCNINYKNKNHETALSLVLNNMYRPENINDFNKLCNYGNIIMKLTNLGYDFNIPIDNDGNTPLMLLMYAQDTATLNYILTNGRNLNLSLKNKYGESVSSLFLKCINHDSSTSSSSTSLSSLSLSSCLNLIIKNPTFDFDYIDPNNKNTMLMIVSIIQPSLIETVLENDINIINSVNNFYENALIIAVKYNNLNSVEKLLKFKIHVNQQDYLGNSALHYAMELKNQKLIQILLINHADINIKNREGKSPMDYAREIGDNTLLELLNHQNLNDSQNINSNLNEYDRIININNDILMTYRKKIDEYLYPCIHTNYSNSINDKAEEILKEVYEREAPRKNSKSSFIF